MGKLKQYLFISFIVLISQAVYPGEDNTVAEAVSSYQSPRFILFFGKETKEQNTYLTEKQIADFALSSLNATYEEYSKLFGKAPVKKVTLRFLSPSEFKRYTGAPAWTSAMYFNDEITIPLNPKKGINLSELGRALRHEYAHAVIAELSAGKCPAWLDEGVAQYLEGRVNPLLGPALRDWIRENDAMPLAWLQNGFTLLNDNLVPAAYAESLFSVRKIIHDSGFESISDYLTNLEHGSPEQEAFSLSFHKDENVFTKELTREIKDWSVTRQINP